MPLQADDGSALWGLLQAAVRRQHDAHGSDPGRQRRCLRSVQCPLLQLALGCEPLAPAFTPLSVTAVCKTVAAAGLG